MQRSISISASIPLISNRPASPPRVVPGVRLKVASIASAAVLIAVGLDPTAATADDGPAAAVIALRGATDSLAIRTSTKGRAASKASSGLYALQGEYQTYLETSDPHARGPSGFTSRNPLARIAEGYVVVDTAAEGDPKALAADLEALGLQNAAVFGHMVSGRLPIPAIPALENLASLRFARPAYAMTLVGSVTSQGDVAMRADIARSTFGVDGTGVTVGTLSDSFNCLGGAAAGVASGDLPAGIVVLEEIGDCQGATDEGRGMMEIIHDVAPGASQAFHTAFEGQASFAQGIIDLGNAGAKVITDDIVYFAEPMFQDGIIAQAVDLVKARGISYFSAAGTMVAGPMSPPSAVAGSSEILAQGLKSCTTSIQVSGLIPASRSPFRWAGRWAKSSNGMSRSSRSAGPRDRRATWTSFSPTRLVTWVSPAALTSTSGAIPSRFSASVTPVPLPPSG
ncbi:MAG: hypothetical protein M3495_07435 [Pseudomonadota bacterium]|nr:hypothetical protein [Pseudomonadota bacterium]